MFYVLEKKVYSGLFGCIALKKKSIGSNCSIVSFKISVALLIFHLEDLFIDESVVDSLLLLYSCQFLPVCVLVFVYLDACILGACMLCEILFLD